MEACFLRMKVADAQRHRVRKTEAAQGVDSMATRPDPTRQTVNEAASEAMRATSEASRRSLQGAQDVLRTTRAYLAESTDANRRLFQPYAEGVEAALKGGFEVQNAVVAAGQYILGASNTSSRSGAQQCTVFAHEAQQPPL